MVLFSLKMSTIMFLLLLVSCVPLGSVHEVSHPGVLVDYLENVKLARHVVKTRLDFQSLAKVLVQLETLRPLEYIWSNFSGVLDKGLATEVHRGAYRELHDTQCHLW